MGTHGASRCRLGSTSGTGWPRTDCLAARGPSRPSPSAHTDGPCLRLYNLNAIKSISHEEFVAGGDLGADSDNTIHGGSSRALEGQEVGCPSVRRAPCSVSWHRAPRRVALGEISIAAEDSAPLSAMDCWRATLLTGPTTTPADARHPNLATASRLSHAGIGRHLLFGVKQRYSARHAHQLWLGTCGTGRGFQAAVRGGSGRAGERRVHPWVSGASGARVESRTFYAELPLSSSAHHRKGLPPCRRGGSRNRERTDARGASPSCTCLVQLLYCPGSPRWRGTDGSRELLAACPDERHLSA